MILSNSMLSFSIRSWLCFTPDVRKQEEDLPNFYRKRISYDLELAYEQEQEIQEQETECQ